MKLVKLVLLFDFDVFHCLRAKLFPAPGLPKCLRATESIKKNSGEKLQENRLRWREGRKKVGYEGENSKRRWFGRGEMKQEVMEGWRREERGREVKRK